MSPELLEDIFDRIRKVNQQFGDALQGETTKLHDVEEAEPKHGWTMHKPMGRITEVHIFRLNGGATEQEKEIFREIK